MAILTASTALFGLAKSTPSVINKILDHWQAFTIATLLAIVFYQNTFDTRLFFWADTIPYLRDVIEDNQEQVQLITAANKSLVATLQRNNERVEEFRVISTGLEQQLSILQSDNQRLRNNTLAQVEKILRGPTPVTCEAAIDLLRSTIPTLHYGGFGPPENK